MRRRDLLALLALLGAGGPLEAGAADATVFDRIATVPDGLDWPALVQAIATHPALQGVRYEVAPLDRGGRSAAEPLRAEFDGFDCVTFVETVLALAHSFATGPRTPARFAAALQRLRYGDGVAPGYCARHHYFSDWTNARIADGLLDEVTATLAADPADLAVLRMTHGIDWLSRNAARSVALAGDAERLACVEAQEARLSAAIDGTAYLRRTRLAEHVRRLQPGDLVAFVADVPGLDVIHVGIVVTRPSGRRELAQASQREGRVMVAPDLVRYAASLRQQRGVRVFRPRRPAAGNADRP